MHKNSPTPRRSNHLPLEIWQYIFLLACTDGGRTGYALTLVSKFFHHASQLTRFQSLAFTSLRQIEGFLTFTQRATMTQIKKPKVQHLLLSFSRCPSHEGSPEFGRADSIYGANPPVADVWFRARQAREQEKAAWDKRFVVILSALLDLVGPHLETFALLQSDAFAIPPLRYRLPRLRELTLLVGITVILNEDEDLPGGSPYWLRGSAPSGSSAAPPSRSHTHPPSISPASASALLPTSSPDYGLEGPPSDGARSTPATRSLGHAHDDLQMEDHVARARFPALERLHIICGRHRDWTLRDGLRHLPRLAPRLAYLRISNATYTHGSHGCVAAFLRGALNLDVSPTEDFRHGVGSSDLDPFADGLVGEGRGDKHAAFTEHAMSRLRHVVVHSIPSPPDAQSATSHKGYRAFSDAMKELLMACESTPVTRMQWRESERSKHQVWEEVCRAQWVERIEGGSGLQSSVWQDTGLTWTLG